VGNFLKVVVFDLGGTLMQYAGMPVSWVDYYCQGFDSIIQKSNSSISKEAVKESL
jgi:putative hydrolase of the HAD superfamily